MNRIALFGFMAGCACAAILPPAPAHAQSMLPEIDVEATPIEIVPSPGYTLVVPDEQYGIAAYDGGQFLSLLPGVSAGRMGGHGVEPVIHGQQQTQLNIVNDGAFIHGGCPNRMDPPSSFTPAETYDTVTVLRGYQSVRYGAGGSGGTVLFDREPLPFSGPDVAWRGNFGAGYESNGNIKDGFADIGGGNQTVQMRAIASGVHADNYEDGSGNEVRSAFQSRSFAFLPVWTPAPGTTLRAGLESTRTDDALFAGASMDAPEDESLTYRIGMTHDIESGALQTLSFNAYSSRVDHVMDNFSLRDNTGMKMKVLSDSDTTGGTLSGDFLIRDIPFTLGLDVQDNNRDAKRYSGMAAATDATTAQSYMWPDVTLRQTGLFAEANPALSETTRLRAGLRYDRVSAKADAAGQTFGSTSPDALYTTYYGRASSDRTENNFGGLLRAEHDISPRLTLFADLSRSVRTADATERFMAGAGTAPWVGNPYLKPEKHHQLDLGATTGGEKWSATASAFYDDVQDFIMRDNARSQNGILVTNSAATVYRNIDATLTGLELEGSYSLTPVLNLNGTLDWTYGQNDEDDDALAQIPPLEGHVALEYTPGDWSLGSRVNFAARQYRIDDGTSQRDPGETDGWATLDLYGAYKLKPFELRIGVSNVFDEDYARHLSRSNAFDPTEVQVNEPGRSAYVRLYARF